MKYNPATSTSSEGFSRNNSAKVLVNQHTGYMNDGRLVNKGRGPTVGNKGCDLEGPKTPPASAVPSLPKQGSVRDNINRGAQVRNPGGTRAFDPKMGQNYKGNADSINMGRGPTKGNAQ
jgi:hypothetical protein